MNKIITRSLVISVLLSAMFALQAQAPKVVPIAQFYTGGQEAMYKFINENLVYPINAKRNRIQGECVVSLNLNADGTMSGVSCVKNIGAGCGEEAIRVVKLLKFNAPGYGSRQNIPVYFRL
jgi:protein TonB